MAQRRISIKRIQINKANTVMVGMVAGAAFVLTFSLVASRALLSKRAYQSRVITEKVKANEQLKKNQAAATTLLSSYNAFIETPDNVIGGNPTGAGDRDGDNGKIVLDALPSKYDFPGLTSSIEKLIASKGLKINSITGTDDEVAQEKNDTAATPQAVEMPFAVSITGNYPSIQDFIGLYEHSIRPIKVKNIVLTGSNSELQTTIAAATYYQPGKSLKIDTKVVK